MNDLCYTAAACFGLAFVIGVYRWRHAYGLGDDIGVAQYSIGSFLSAVFAAGFILAARQFPSE